MINSCTAGSRLVKTAAYSEVICSLDADIASLTLSFVVAPEFSDTVAVKAEHAEARFPPASPQFWPVQGKQVSVCTDVPLAQESEYAQYSMQKAQKL